MRRRSTKSAWHAAMAHRSDVAEDTARRLEEYMEQVEEERKAASDEHPQVQMLSLAPVGSGVDCSLSISASSAAMSPGRQGLLRGKRGRPNHADHRETNEFFHSTPLLDVESTGSREYDASLPTESLRRSLTSLSKALTASFSKVRKKVETNDDDSDDEFEFRGVVYPDGTYRPNNYIQASGFDTANWLKEPGVFVNRLPSDTLVARLKQSGRMSEFSLASEEKPLEEPTTTEYFSAASDFRRPDSRLTDVPTTDYFSAKSTFMTPNACTGSQQLPNSNERRGVPLLTDAARPREPLIEEECFSEDSFILDDEEVEKGARTPLMKESENPYGNSLFFANKLKHVSGIPAAPRAMLTRLDTVHGQSFSKSHSAAIGDHPWSDKDYSRSASAGAGLHSESPSAGRRGFPTLSRTVSAMVHSRRYSSSGRKSSRESLPDPPIGSRRVGRHKTEAAEKRRNAFLRAAHRIRARLDRRGVVEHGPDLER